MSYGHVVFDIDGTLIDTEKAVLLSLQETMRQAAGVTIPMEELRPTFGIPGKETLRNFGVRDLEKYRLIWNKLFDKYIGTVRVFPGIRETLAGLKKAGVSIGVITSKIRSEYIREFVPFGLAGYVGISVCSDETEKPKPHPEPMLKYLEQSGAKPREVLYVGDTGYDLSCADGAEVDFALALWGSHDSGGLRPTYACKKPTEILSILGIR